jgi:hypothetical protein
MGLILGWLCLVRRFIGERLGHCRLWLFGYVER